MTGALLSVRDLRVEFATRKGPLVALDGVSFDIAPGEVLGVVGESGAGKSVTGLAIIGLLEPPGRIAAGEVRLEGRRIDNLAPEEMTLYDGVYRLLDARRPKPDLVVYISAKVQVLAERLRKRNRNFERNISFEYLERVSVAFRDFFFYYDETPLLVVDTSEIDFVEDSEDLRELVREIETAGKGVQHFVPRKR